MCTIPFLLRELDPEQNRVSRTHAAILNATGPQQLRRHVSYNDLNIFFSLSQFVPVPDTTR
jgi:hypothetical protein